MEMQQEDLVEINELVHEIEQAFNEICSSNDFDGEIDKKLKRDLHSLKGILGMFGMNMQMSYIHEIEDGLTPSGNIEIKIKIMDYYLMRIQEFEKSIEFGLPFYYQLGENEECEERILLDNFTENIEKTVELVESNFGISFDLSNLDVVDPAILKKENEKLQLLKKKLQKNFVYIGSNSNIMTFLDQKIEGFSCFESFEEVYNQFRDFKNLKMAIVDVTDINCCNPFLFQISLFKIFPNIHFVYICNSYEELGEALCELEEEKPLSFTFIKKPSIGSYINDTIENFLQGHEISL